MIVVTGTVPFKAEFEEQLLDAARTVTAATRAEDGCLAYSLTLDLLEPNTAIICEMWRDDAALDAHMAASHMAVFIGTIMPMLANAPVIERHDISATRSLLG